MHDEEIKLRIAGVVEDSIVDGPGLRMTVFTQGCLHACPGCHNPHTHDFQGGDETTVGELYARMVDNPLCSGLTLSGGEPLCQAAACGALVALAKKAGKNVWLYSGYTWEQIISIREGGAEAPGGTPEAVGRLIDHTDVLVDGPFILAQRSLTLPFRGSANQRLIDVPASLEMGEAVLWSEQSTG